MMIKSVLWLAAIPVVMALTVSMPPQSPTADHLPLAKQAMDFLDSSPDPFHCVQTSIELLKQAGYTEMEPSTGDIQPGKNKDTNEF